MDVFKSETRPSEMELHPIPNADGEANKSEPKQSRLGSHDWCGTHYYLSVSEVQFPSILGTWEGHMTCALANERQAEVMLVPPRWKVFNIHFAIFHVLFVFVWIWRHPKWQSFCQPQSWSGDATEQRPLSVRAGHGVWAINKPLLFKAWRFERLFVTATGLHVSPSWLIKLGPGIWNTIPGTTFTGNLNLSAHIWRRSFAVQKQIKEAKRNLFSLFPQRDLSVGSLINT